MPAQRICSQNCTKCADSQFPIWSQEYSSGEGKWRFDIICTGSWCGSLNYIGNGSRKGRSKEWSTVGEKRQHKNLSLLSFSPSLYSDPAIRLSERILYVKPHLLYGLINATTTLAFSEKHVHLHSVCYRFQHSLSEVICSWQRLNRHCQSSTWFVSPNMLCKQFL